MNEKQNITIKDILTYIELGQTFDFKKYKVDKKTKAEKIEFKDNEVIFAFEKFRNNQAVVLKEKPSSNNYLWTFFGPKKMIVENDENDFSDFYAFLKNTAVGKGTLYEALQKQVPNLKKVKMEVDGVTFSLFVDEENQQIYNFIKEANIKTSLSQHILNYLISKTQYKDFNFNNVIKLKERHYYKNFDDKGKLHYVIVNKILNDKVNKDDIFLRFIYFKKTINKLLELQKIGDVLKQNGWEWNEVKNFIDWFESDFYKKRTENKIIDEKYMATILKFLKNNPIMENFDILLKAGVDVKEDDIIVGNFVLDGKSSADSLRNNIVGKNKDFKNFIDPNFEWVEKMVEQTKNLLKETKNIEQVENLKINKNGQEIEFEKQRMKILDEFWANSLIGSKIKIDETLILENEALKQNKKLFKIQNDDVVKDIYQTMKDKKNVYFDFESFLCPTSVLAYWKPDSHTPFQVSWEKDFGDKKGMVETFIIDSGKIDYFVFKNIVESFYDPEADNYVVYNKSFENMVLESIKKNYNLLKDNGFDEISKKEIEELIEKIEEIQNKFVDLRDLFKIHKGQTLPPIQVKDFLKKSSIKLVSKFLQENYDLDTKTQEYQNLKIKRGDEASNAAMKRFIGEIDDEEWKNINEDLKIYCNNDVKEMVKIFEFLERTINNNLEEKRTFQEKEKRNAKLSF